ncbi:DUF2096 family protein [Methanothermococcus sp. SCGC AD-155-M21]|nr:DUF2096 family protein [Methanothermococcus sp. SCGC AD-155-M21]
MKNAHGIEKQWVVLEELATKLIHNGKVIPEEVFFRLRIANSIISYYLIDEHASIDMLMKANNELSKIQSVLFSLCDNKLAEEYLDKLSKAMRNDLDVEFPINRNKFNVEVKKRKNVEAIRVKLNNDLQSEILSDLSEWYGVIFEYSGELDNTIVIEGSKDRVKNALKNFSIIWKFQRDNIIS